MAVINNRLECYNNQLKYYTYLYRWVYGKSPNVAPSDSYVLSHEIKVLEQKLRQIKKFKNKIEKIKSNVKD
jgi:hypothetical protein